MKLVLPFPPSVNTYWRAPNKGPRGRWPVVTSLALMVVNTRALPAWRSLSNYDVSRSHRLNWQR